MEKVITTTTVKASDAKKHGLTLETILEKLEADTAPSFDKKAELPVGIFVDEKDDGSFTVYTVEETDLKAGFAELDEEEQWKCSVDGYKRTHHNKPAHENVKHGLGLIEQTAAQKTKDRVLWDLAVKMTKSGMALADIKRITGGSIPDAMLEAAAAQAND